MRALILQQPGQLSLSTVPIPQPGPGEVLVKVRAATTCGTDLKAFLRGHPQIPMPGVFGHEYAGDVAAVGPGAPFSVGQAVMGVHSAPCGECFWCTADQDNLCERIMATKVLGSYAEYLLIPAHIARMNLFERPESLSETRASLLEPLACVAHGVEQLGLRLPGARILVIGPGAIGLMFVAALRQSGHLDVTLAGRNRHRLALGEGLGARAIAISDAERTMGIGYDAVVECTGNVEVWEQSVNYSRRGGTVMLFGGCPAGTHVAFDTKRLHYDQITLKSPFHFGPRAVQQAREWLLDPLMRLDGIISGERTLEDGEAVFEDLRHGHGVKYVFRP